MKTRPESPAAYDDLVEEYDETWSIHVGAPQQRLTRELQLRPGLRCADIGCGTGTETVEMLRATAPGEMVAVDCSALMLRAAQLRAHDAGLSLTLERCDAATFIAEARGFDVVSLRFCLGYLDWRALLPRMPQMVKPGGRLGMLTILATSAPQAYEAYEQMIRGMRLPAVQRSAPESLTEIEEALAETGCEFEAQWLHSFRLLFATGQELARFLSRSGLASHPLLDQLPQDALAMLWGRFAEILESQRTPSGIPLDFDLGGFVARVRP